MATTSMQVPLDSDLAVGLSWWKLSDEEEGLFGYGFRFGIWFC